MTKLKPNQQIWLFSILWILVNIIQAVFSPLAKDETYYWAYSLHLDWGYFDHPPMIALFIYLGSFINGPLGIKLTCIVSQALALFLVWKTISHNRKNEFIPYFYLIAFCIPLLNIYGFVSTPDAPLLLTAAFFLYIYKIFNEKKNIFNSLLLGLAMALLLYSKYHGVLLILFVLFSNIKLLKCKYYYLAAIFGFLLFLPHIYWQYSNDFPSFTYHILTRSKGAKWFFFPEYILIVLLIFNPAFLVFSYKKLLNKNNTQNSDNTSLWAFWGFIIFFLAMTFKWHIQPQWIIVACLPFLKIFYEEICENETTRKKFLLYAYITLGILIVARIILISNVLTISSLIKNSDEAISEINNNAQNRPVMIQNSYMNASMYGYFTNQDSIHSNNTMFSRKSQYDVWRFEERYHNRNICYVTGIANSEQSKNKFFEYYYIDTFQAINKLKAIVINDTLTSKANDSLRFDIEIKNPYTYIINCDTKNKIVLQLLIQNKKREIIFAPLNILNGIIRPNSTDTIHISHYTNQLPGEYKLGVCIKYGFIDSYSPSNLTKLIVTE